MIWGSTMTTVRDVAGHILRKQGSMSAMKLQKLSYYSQAWHLVWEDKPLFDDRIEAWANGPVAPALYDIHRHEFTVTEQHIPDPKPLTPEQESTVNEVLRFYGERSAWELSHLTHSEDPWRLARAGTPDGARSNVEISTGSMAMYYGALT
jgi:uncharacterized phage-associated protein